MADGRKEQIRMASPVNGRSLTGRAALGKMEFQDFPRLNRQGSSLSGRSGGIGRRAAFRSQWPQGRRGSNPRFGKPPFPAGNSLCGSFLGAAPQADSQAGPLHPDLLLIPQLSWHPGAGKLIGDPPGARQSGAGTPPGRPGAGTAGRAAPRRGSGQCPREPGRDPPSPCSR